MKKVPQLLKGFRDYLPNEQMGRKKMINKISEVYERYGFAPIDTPALEYFELLAGKYGEEGEKLMYKFEDQGGRMVALRYDLTVPLARILGTYTDLPKPFKRYQIAPVWRADKPQKGRYREFMQCDIDIVGSSSINADVEVIAAMDAAYKALDLADVMVKYNNRELIDKALQRLKVPKDETIIFVRILDKRDKIGDKEVEKMLKASGFEKGILASFSEIMEELSNDYVVQMEGLLSGTGVENFVFDKYLMRGLDYYTGVVFEFVFKSNPEFGSIGGGGRYDNLIGQTAGKEFPAVGGSIGLDRMYNALSELGVIAPQTATEVLIMNLDDKLTPEYMNIMTNLRGAGIDCEFYYDAVKLDKPFKYAEAKNMKLAIIFGPDEAKKKKVNIKD